jgi:hypothetical protein
MEHPLRCVCEVCDHKRKIEAQSFSLQNRLSFARENGNHAMITRLEKELKILENQGGELLSHEKAKSL